MQSVPHSATVSKYSSVAQWQSIRLLTGGLLVRVQPEEPITSGLSQIATVLSELAEKIDPAKLAVTAAAAPVPWAQRLGYLLDLK